MYITDTPKKLNATNLQRYVCMHACMHAPGLYVVTLLHRTPSKLYLSEGDLAKVGAKNPDTIMHHKDHVDKMHRCAVIGWYLDLP